MGRGKNPAAIAAQDWRDFGAIGIVSRKQPWMLLDENDPW
jgi:hypothetical protein